LISRINPTATMDNAGRYSFLIEKICMIILNTDYKF
jgi:hypothetical protein